LSYRAILLYGPIRADEVSPSVGPTGCLDWVKGSVSCQFEVCILRERRTDDDRLEEGSSPLPDVTEAEMLVFLAITIQMGQTTGQHPTYCIRLSAVTL
jgi:hypothetical protein